MTALSTQRIPLAGGLTAHYVFTDRSHGDLHIGSPAADLARRRERVAAMPWTWLRQVHGDHVVTVEHPGQHAGVEADGAVTTIAGAALAVHTADCAPVLITGSGQAGAGLAAVHAGWKGLETGILERAVGRMHELGIDSLTAVLGPCIHAACYEFGADDLARLADRFGAEVVAETSNGRPALDMVAAVRAALRGQGVDLDVSPSVCTGCGEGNFSHRVRQDAGRQALVAWLATEDVA